MDNSEFESRAFADPDDSDQSFLDAVKDNPARQQMLDELRALNARIGEATNRIAFPDGLAERLKSVTREADQAPVAASSSSTPGDSRFWQPLRMLAMAAALVLAVGLSYTTLLGGSNPSAEELAFGQQVLDHVYRELAEIDSRPGANLQQVNRTVGAVGGSMNDDQVVTRLRITFARPCAILPPNQSAHLVMEGNRGAVNIIIINNSPVQHEFKFNDERFDTVVIPIEGGNLILVGEHDEPLGDFRRVVDDNMEWLI